MNGTAFYNDIDPFCCNWLRNLVDAGELPQGHIEQRSIIDVTLSSQVRMAGSAFCQLRHGMSDKEPKRRLAICSFAIAFHAPRVRGSACVPCQELAIHHRIRRPLGHRGSIGKNGCCLNLDRVYTWCVRDKVSLPLDGDRETHAQTLRCWRVGICQSKATCCVVRERSEIAFRRRGIYDREKTVPFCFYVPPMPCTC